jgi:hypothetical protein
MPLFSLCCAEMQDSSWGCMPLSTLQRLGLNCKSSTSCNLMLWRRGSAEWHKECSQWWNQQFYLSVICTPGPKAYIQFLSILYQYGSLVHHISITLQQHVDQLFFSIHLVQWVIENNHSINIINDRELYKLLTTGCPKIELPTHITIFQDIIACFIKCSIPTYFFSSHDSLLTSSDPMTIDHCPLMWLTSSDRSCDSDLMTLTCIDSDCHWLISLTICILYPWLTSDSYYTWLDSCTIRTGLYCS